MEATLYKVQITLLICFFYQTIFSQGIAVNNTGITADPSAMLDISASNKGLLIPRVTLQVADDAVTVPSPEHGLLVYNTNAAMEKGNGEGYYENHGDKINPQWLKLITMEDLPTVPNAWLITGNDNINPNIHFIGTNNNNDVIVKRNGVEALRITAGGTLLATGDVNTGISSIGNGHGMMWVPAKWAFRAGLVQGGEWNTDEIGIGSFAVGNSTRAKGDYSSAFGNHSKTAAIANTAFAAGSSAEANEQYAVAIGFKVKANGLSAVALGNLSTAEGAHSFTAGYKNLTDGIYSAAIGANDTATGSYAIALGNSNKASGGNSFTAGYKNLASGNYSAAIGANDTATGSYAIALGNNNKASGSNSFTTGLGNIASSSNSMAMGKYSIASGITSTAMGSGTDASGEAATTMGTETKASGGSSTALGYRSNAIGFASLAAGASTLATKSAAIAMGANTQALGDFSLAAGLGAKTFATAAVAFGSSTAEGNYSVAMGFDTNTDAGAEAATSMGFQTSASAKAATAMGTSTKAFNENAVAMGYQSQAMGKAATAMGTSTKASNENAVAIGNLSLALGKNSTAMGNGSEASGENAVAGGDATKAKGNNSFTLGYSTQADTDNSVATGYDTRAFGFTSTAMGRGTVAEARYSTVVGLYNDLAANPNPNASSPDDKLFEVGGGQDADNRRNAFTVLRNGFTGFNIANPTSFIHINDDDPWNRNDIKMEHIWQGEKNTGYLSYDVNGLKFRVEDGQSITFYAAGNFTNQIVGISSSMSVQGKIYADDFVNASDIRLKNNIVPLHNVLEKINQIHPIYFHFNKDLVKSYKDRYIGFSAQEVQKQFPELVRKRDDGYLGVEYANMSAVLLQAVKEQQQMIDQLNKRLNEKDKENAQLKSQLEAIAERLNKLEQK